ncbi:MAG: dehydrogenase [Burkholderiales bacterium]|nr:MAG: dehydrogenase [Burkholderiales bacterium]
MCSDQARAYWIVSPRRSEIRTEALPVPAAGEVRVRALYSGISRGSETLVFRGEVPAAERERMRAPFQAGDFPGPVKYGYASVGVVEQGPDDLVGRTVFCLHPHQDRYVVPVAAVHAVPASVPAPRAVLAANLETALNAVWDAGLCVGDRVGVVGGGVVGLLVAWLAARIPGCRVELIDVDASRAAAASALGVTFSAPDAAAANADCVFHASGTGDGLGHALRLAGFEASVIELSWYGTRAISVPLGEGFHSKRLVLRSSQVGAVAAVQRARWSHRRRIALALELLDDPRLDALVVEESDFDELPELMARLADGTLPALCHRVVYR